MEWLRSNPIGSNLITLAIAILIMLAVLSYCKKKYFDISVDTNKRMRNIEKHIVPDSLIYFENER